MIVLGFDTSGPWCAAALLRDSRQVAVRAENMARGQAEALMPMLEATLADAGLTWRDLAALGVCTGPGNFTGIRIGVAAARGLAMALEIPAVGVTAFEARAACRPGQLVAVPAPRDQLYIADPVPRLAPAAEIAGAVTDADPAALAAAIARLAQDRAADAVLPSPAPLYVRPADAAPSRDLPPAILDG